MTPEFAVDEVETPLVTVFVVVDPPVLIAVYVVVAVVVDVEDADPETVVTKFPDDQVQLFG